MKKITNRATAVKTVAGGQKTKVGRPSVAEARRTQILAAFVKLLGERGLANLTLDDVAAEAGLQRTVVRHFVGNRDHLVLTATEHLIGRYTASIREAIGEEPSARTIIDHLFGREWVVSQVSEDRALDELFQEAARSTSTRTQLRGAYLMLANEIAAAIRRSAPTLDLPTVEDAAYEIVCLAEFNVTLQRLGFPRPRSEACRKLALEIVDKLNRSATARSSP